MSPFTNNLAQYIFKLEMMAHQRTFHHWSHAHRKKWRKKLVQESCKYENEQELKPHASSL